MFLVRTFMFTRGTCRGSRDRSRFGRRRCAFHCSSSRVPVAWQPHAGNQRGWRTSERTCGRGACTVQVRRRRNRGENSLIFSPHCLSPRCLASSRTTVPIRTARSHAGSNAASCYCSPRCPLVRSWRFQPKISAEMSTFKAEADPLFLRETVACVYMTVVCTRVSMNDVDKKVRSSHFDHLNSYLYLRNFLCPRRYRDVKRKGLIILSATSISTRKERLKYWKVSWCIDLKITLFGILK